MLFIKYCEHILDHQINVDKWFGQYYIKKYLGNIKM